MLHEALLKRNFPLFKLWHGRHCPQNFNSRNVMKSRGISSVLLGDNWSAKRYLKLLMNKRTCRKKSDVVQWAACYWWFNTLRPRHVRHFVDDIFQHIFLNENVWISIEISLKFVPKGPIINIPAMVQIMAWRAIVTCELSIVNKLCAGILYKICNFSEPI